MADVASTLPLWSATAASNGPQGTTSVATGLDDNLREIGKVVRGWLATKGANIASATTTDLGAIEGLSHSITGTTTITSFGTVSAGIWKVVIFAGALTLTHNSTSLILPGGASLTTAAGDVAILQSEGSGNWRCWSYVKASGVALKVDINGVTAETAPAVADELLIYDASAAANRKITLANLLNVITLMTAEATVVGSDEVLLYDASEAATNKATLTNVVTGMGATAAEMEAGSSLAVVVTPGRINRHPGVAKAAIKFTGGGTPTAVDTYNASSTIVDNGTGDYTVTWSTAFSNANYEYAISNESNTTTVARAVSVRNASQTTTTLRVISSDMDGVLTDVNVSIVVFGDWA